MYDQAAYKALVADTEVIADLPAEERFGHDPRNLKLYFFVDGMLSVRTDKGSDKVTICYVGPFNAAPHLRCQPGIGLPVFVTSRIKNCDHLLEVVDDELRYLRFVSCCVLLDAGVGWWVMDAVLLIIRLYLY